MWEFFKKTFLKNPIGLIVLGVVVTIALGGSLKHGLDIFVFVLGIIAIVIGIIWLIIRAKDKGQLSGKNPSGLTDRAIKLYDAGNYDEAMRVVNKAIELDPNYGDAYAARASVYRKFKEYDKAIADYTEAIKHPDKYDPSRSYTIYCRGHAYEEKADIDRAIEDYNQALKLTTSSSTIEAINKSLSRVQAMKKN